MKLQPTAEKAGEQQPGQEPTGVHGHGEGRRGPATPESPNTRNLAERG